MPQRGGEISFTAIGEHDAYFSFGKWHCDTCKAAGDRPYMENTGCRHRSTKKKWPNSFGLANLNIAYADTITEHETDIQASLINVADPPTVNCRWNCKCNKFRPYRNETTNQEIETTTTTTTDWLIILTTSSTRPYSASVQNSSKHKHISQCNYKRP